MDKQNTSRTGGATLSITELPHNEEVANKLLQALLRLASFELESTNGFNTRLKYFKVFISLPPPEYTGNFNSSSEGLDWLQRVKQCLDVIGVPGDLRVGFAAYTFTGAAGYWWDFVKRSCDVESMTWDDFEKMFLNRYVPETTRLAKVSELYLLTQGEMTVFQYDSKFIELSRYALNLLTSDKERAERFVLGLRPSIRMELICCKYDTYEQVVTAALRVEQFDNTRNQRELESFEGDSGRGRKRKRKQYTCHNRGEPGHIRPRCPN